MLVMSLLFIFVGVEIGLGILTYYRSSQMVKEKAYIRLTESLGWLVLILSPVIEWSFRWYGISLWLLVVAIFSVRGYLKKGTSKENKKYKSGIRCMLKVVLTSVLINMLLVPAMVFPQDASLEPDGPYQIETVSYTWTDLKRPEYFTPEDDYRKITVQFWYPSEQQAMQLNGTEKYPLVVFSHGAFGVRASNYSTYTQLASHGYVVCSMDHSYHAAMTEQTDGKIILGNKEFMNQAMTLSSKEDSLEKYEIVQGWQKLRVEDVTFCLEQIKGLVDQTIEDEIEGMGDEVFRHIEIDNIGVMGHSLGGSAAAGIGRTIKEVKAVAVIDGTMLGEEIGFEDGKEVVTDKPYPVPLLNFYNGAAYKEIQQIEEFYPNSIASKSQKDSYEIVITNAGHMNFTDLSMISPVLSKFLGGEDIDSKACMQFVNDTILEFFDGYLKGKPMDLPKEQQIEI